MAITPATDTIDILVTGASGYLGQHMLDHWMKTGPIDTKHFYRVTALYNSSTSFANAIAEKASRCHPNVQIIAEKYSLQESVTDGNNLGDDAWDVCIHLAAMSSPRMCQQDREKAHDVNVPKQFLKSMQNVAMIVLSTDQVYDGKREDNDRLEDFYKETSQTNPLNAYAETKVLLEQSLKELRHSSPTICLRSSIILGPPAPLCHAHDTFFQFCHSRKDQETKLWANEYRTVLSVGHACRVIDWMVTYLITSTNPKGMFEIFNLGGPHRVNRVDMGKVVFQHFGFSTDCLKPAIQTAPTVPLDISMDSTKLLKWTGIAHMPPTMKELVKYSFPNTHP